MHDKIPCGVSYPRPASLDSAYQRKAIDQGFSFEDGGLFPENKQYYLDTKAGKISPCRAHGSLDPNVEAVKESLSKRSKEGYKKYGTDTTRKDLSALDWLQHLQEELMDASIYIEVLKERFKNESK